MDTQLPMDATSKILQQLASAGILRAASDGDAFELAQAPSTIRFVDVFQAMRGDTKSAGSALGWPTRRGIGSDIHQTAAQAVHQAFHSWSRKITLADILTDIQTQGAQSFYRDILELDREAQH